MRFLILNRFYWPDESGTSIHATDLCEDLVALGHEVHVACARTRYDRPKEALVANEERHGVHIHRLWSTRFGRSGKFQRLLDLASFQCSLRICGPWLCKPDAIFVMTDPPMVLGAGRWIQLLRGGRLFHFAADLYPDIAVMLGMLKENSWATKVLARKYARWLGCCSKVFVLGEGGVEVLRKKGVSDVQLVLTRPWADGGRLGHIPAETNAFRSSLGLSAEDVVVMYSGNMGHGHGFETILNGIEILAADARLHFLFVGTGAQRDAIERIAKGKGLNAVRMIPFQPMERIRESLAAADIHLVSQDPRTVGLIVPSKFAGALASGRPVVFVGCDRAEIAECIVKHNCGRFVEDGQPQQFADAIKELAQDAGLRAALGWNARKIFELEYDRKVVVKKIIDAMIL